MDANQINGSEVRAVYRGTAYATERNPEHRPRLFVTVDGKIWIGYGPAPESFSHVANVGDRGTSGTSRDAVLRAANA